jgi:uncharacterized protein YPO0396
MAKSQSQQVLLSGGEGERPIEASTAMPQSFDPNALDGYRLHRLEILNWGSFDKDVHIFLLDGETSLLVGQNGSGKSTLVDAVLTLLVPSAIRNYNVAAGGKKRERSEISYIQGAYGQSSDEDDDNKTKKDYLRPKSNKSDKLTILLASFRNAAFNHVVTLAQILRLDSEGKSQHVFCLDTRDRSILGDIYPIDSFDGIIPKLKGKGFEAWREFAQYKSAFAKIFHLKEKAMEVFNQTVAVKDIEKLDTFIRRYMLDSVSWKKKIDPITEHFADLKSHRNIALIVIGSNGKNVNLALGVINNFPNEFLSTQSRTIFPS